MFSKMHPDKNMDWRSTTKSPKLTQQYILSSVNSSERQYGIEMKTTSSEIQDTGLRSQSPSLSSIF